MTKGRQTGAAALRKLLTPYARRVETDLRRWLVEPGTPGELAEAMRYCVLGGGKRLRPALVHMTAAAVGQAPPREPARRAAVAVELVHAYSLVHDDLPAMDDDLLRRGRPTAHVKFGQAMAILAGDAMLTRAFAVLAEGRSTPGTLAGCLVGELARGAGPAGMIAGQVADMDLCRVGGGAAGLRYIHLHKTAALILAAARMGAMCGGASRPALAAVSRYAEALGLAFQAVDDLLDVTGAAGTIGKTPGKDARSRKRTYVSHVGLERARSLADALTARATAALAPLGDRAENLRRLADLLARRTH